MRVPKTLTEEQKARKRVTHRLWCASHREQRRESTRKCIKARPEVSKKWVSENKHRKKRYGAKYRQTHRKHVKAKSKSYHLKRYHSDYEFRARILNQSKRWALLNPEARRKSGDKWRKKNLRHCSMKCAKRRALVRNGEGDNKGLRDFIKRSKSLNYLPCYYCGVSFPSKEMHVDHINPICNGGKHSASNICWSCPKCNQTKNRSTLDEWPKKGQRFLNL